MYNRINRMPENRSGFRHLKVESHSFYESLRKIIDICFEILIINIYIKIIIQIVELRITAEFG